jgi:anti-sigma factor RsiW
VVKYDTSNAHLSAEQLQAFLEKELPARDLTSIEEHLAGCKRCSSELEAWTLLFEDLGDLSSHRPHEGFADRVMSNVTVPQSVSLGHRVLGHIEGGLAGALDAHVPSETLQDFMDGALAARRGEKIERHLAACSDCAGEAQAWLMVMNQLAGLESFQPRPDFADRVMREVEVVETLPFAARAKARIAAFLGTSRPEHVPTGLLQDLVDGSLPANAVARVQEHVGQCIVCSNEVEAWQAVTARLDSLGHFAPAAEFSDRVMAGLAAQGSADVARTPAWSRLVAAAWRLVPQSREAWAALSGVAVTPAVVAGLMVYAVFSHPTLTLGSLASFAWWQVADLGAIAMTAVSTMALQSVETLGVTSLFSMLASAPSVVAGGVLLYTMASALALRVLYKNLFANRPTNGRYAHASTTS